MYSFPGGSEVKASACNAGDLGLIPGSGRSPGEGNGNPLQYSCLENPMDWGAWWATVHRVAKSRTRLSDFTSLNQQGLTVYHRELCSTFCYILSGKRTWKRIHTCICITESRCCTPETLLINCCCCSVAKLCLTLSWSHVLSPPGSPVHGTSQARILEWAAISFSRGSAWPRNQTWVLCISRWILYCWSMREAH